MKSTITGRIVPTGPALRAYTRDAVLKYRAVDSVAQRRAAERAFPHGIKQHVRAGLERDGYHVEDGVHDSLIATASIEKRIFDHYTAPSWRARLATRLRQWWCAAAHGHDALLHFEGKRITMRCTSCGHDTPGWDVSDRGPRQRYEGDARRHALTPQRLAIRKTN